jgi:hypothetical protein
VQLGVNTPLLILAFIPRMVLYSKSSYFSSRYQNLSLNGHQKTGVNMLTDLEIERAKKNVKYTEEVLHESNDCIRIAYEWLDAQKKNKTTSKVSYPLKHYIERWAGRYVSQTDVEVAAYMHPDIHGQYPKFNISSNLVKPLKERLNDIPEAFISRS